MKKIKALRKRIEEAQEGFTLIELIIVIAIIGILVAIAIPVYGTIQGNAREGTVKSSAKSGVSVALANHYQGKSEAEITAEVLKADTAKIKHDVTFLPSSIEVRAEYANPSDSDFAVSIMRGNFSADGSNGNDGGGTETIEFGQCDPSLYPYTAGSQGLYAVIDWNEEDGVIHNPDHWPSTHGQAGNPAVCNPATGEILPVAF